VGKSTFLNRVLGQKLSITSPKPQTTRNSVVGIHNAEGVQAIFVDTPGHHEAWSGLNKSMVKIAETTTSEVDVVLLLVDLVPAVAQVKQEKQALSAGEEALVALISKGGKPVVLGLNKIDAVDREWALPVIQAWTDAGAFKSVVPFSALDGEGVDRLLEEVLAHLPEHPAYFPADQLSESSERFVVSELIREQLYRLLEKELPYATAVQIEAFDEERRTSGKPVVVIHARILVERGSQKGIVIGKGGQMLKRIGSSARRDIEKLLGCKVHLKLFVKVSKDWSENPRILRELGLEKP
jgi:GTP-binding protein Era